MSPSSSTSFVRHGPIMSPRSTAAARSRTGARAQIAQEAQASGSTAECDEYKFHRIVRTLFAQVLKGVLSGSLDFGMGMTTLCRATHDHISFVPRLNDADLTLGRCGFLASPAVCKQILRSIFYALPVTHGSLRTIRVAFGVGVPTGFVVI